MRDWQLRATVVGLLLAGIVALSQAQDVRVNPPLGLSSASGDVTCTAAGVCTVGGNAVTASSTTTFTNKTFNSSATGNVLQVSGVTVSRGQYPGTNTNDSPTAGNIGDYVESNIAAASAVSLTTNLTANITSIPLPAGDWDVSLNAYLQMTSTTATSTNYVTISTTSSTEDVTNGRYAIVPSVSNTDAVNRFSLSVPPVRLSLSGTTTVYATATSAFTVSTMKVFGLLRARRVR